MTGVSEAGSVKARPSLATIWAWLETVPDPEIPVLSVVDLGVVRDLEWRGERLVVTVTPTYSGCPASAVINFDIEQALRTKGIEALVLERQLSPAWSSEWISEKGREALRKFGIAPPNRDAAQGSHAIACPRCDSMNTRLVSAFGSTPCKSAHRCDDCLEPFDYFKCI